MTDQVIEAVQFKLKKEVTRQEFLTAAEQTRLFVSSLQGFKSRRLAQKEDGDWLDIVEWNSLQEAMSAAEIFMLADEVKPFIMMIEPESIQMQHFKTRLMM